ncbi:hypothetical protein GOB93_02835 [Acetobacter musti]|uniref:DUF2268 domain-containing protein n=1 Tax=Acetobacter musti TaxID=864732 RepID=A0ABX0JJG6_9PROT|nr:DUF2268 domain-containing putative Zn-dependent protease [Acetobacter musti]NHN83576.1 hypothetical protein [Acetobacter musti]
MISDRGDADRWHLHWLTAGGTPNLPVREAVMAGRDEAFLALAGLRRPPALDILVNCSRAVIPETGCGGRALRPDLFELRLDPKNAALGGNLATGVIRRTILHEVHHCMRMAGPGYGLTLGEALVSEGLAGRFVQHLLRTPPEPWECAVGEEVLPDFMPSDEQLWTRPYDHAGWFFGAGGRYPRWLGYSLGFWLAGCWVRSVRPEGEAWTGVSAREVIETGRRVPDES